MTFIQNLHDWLIGAVNSEAVNKRRLQRPYQVAHPAFGEQWGIVDFARDFQLMLLGDGVSVGSGFELASLATEAATPAYLEQVWQKLSDLLAHAIPLYADDPWVMQCYVQDDYRLLPALAHVQAAIEPEITNSAFTEDYVNRLKHLFAELTKPQGLFIDPLTDAPFRGRTRRIRLLFYRRYDTLKTTRDKAIAEHLALRQSLMTKLNALGLAFKVLEGGDYYDWWVRWFNPKPALTHGDVDQLLACYPYQPDLQAASHQWPGSLLFANPASDEHGLLFDDLPHRVLFLPGLRELPLIGLLSRERPQANPKHRYALLDKLPAGAIYTLQLTFHDEKGLTHHLHRLEKGIVGTHLKATQVRDDIKNARDALSVGDHLIWATQAILYRAANSDDAARLETELSHLFHEAKLPLLSSKVDLHPINSYLHVLPFNFVPAFAKAHIRLDKLLFTSEVAALLPIYGRNQGTPELPCFTFFNRLGEPVFYDLLHPDFINQNSHCAIFANSGGGKSVLLGYLMVTLLAVKQARLVVFEMGHSFDRLLTHCREHGKVVKQLLLSSNPNEAVPLNPFSDAYLAIPDIKSIRPDFDEVVDDTKLEGRSILTELTLSLRTMLTEANPRAEQDFSLADETLLLEVLTDAIITAYQTKQPQLLTEHILHAFIARIARESNLRKRERLDDMAERLKSYVINPAKARFFNVATEPLTDFDVFHVDVSAIKDDKGKLALVMASLLPRILALAERTQTEKRPMFLVIDEAHLQFDIEVITAYALLIAKVARKLGLWLIPVTQNISDLKSVNAMKLLSLMETWLVLGLDEKELNDIKQFKALSPEQEHLIRGLRAQKGLFSEGVLLGARHQGLFRIILPPYFLALLMTEKSEKVERAALEAAHGILPAAEIMASRLVQKARDKQEHHHAQ